MDRRYSQAKGASDGAGRRSDALVRSYLGRAKAAYRAGQSYGGSTGGASNDAGRYAAPQTSALRAKETGEAREIFRTYGSGELGASALGGRGLSAEARGFRLGDGQGGRVAGRGFADIAPDSTGLQMPT